MSLRSEKSDFKNISEYVYTNIRHMILTLKFPPNSKLSEAKVSDLLQTSKTPVREAFIKLAEESLIYISPQRGTFVSHIDCSRVEEGRFARKAIENEVLNVIFKDHRKEAMKTCGEILQAHEKITDCNHEEHFYYDSLFHQEMYNIIGMSRIFDTLTKMNVDYHRARYLALVDIGKESSILEDHRKIYQAICDNNLESAIEETNQHLDRWNEEKPKILQHFESYFIIN